MDRTGKVIPKAIHDHLHAETPAISRETATNCPSSTAMIDLDPLILKAMNDTYQQEVGIYKELLTEYSQEKHRSRQERKLKKISTI